LIFVIEAKQQEAIIVEYTFMTIESLSQQISLFNKYAFKQ